MRDAIATAALLAATAGVALRVADAVAAGAGEVLGWR